MTWVAIGKQPVLLADIFSKNQLEIYISYLSVPFPSLHSNLGESLAADYNLYCVILQSTHLHSANLTGS